MAKTKLTGYLVLFDSDPFCDEPTYREFTWEGNLIFSDAKYGADTLAIFTRKIFSTFKDEGTISVLYRDLEGVSRCEILAAKRSDVKFMFPFLTLKGLRFKLVPYRYLGLHFIDEPSVKKGDSNV